MRNTTTNNVYTSSDGKAWISHVSNVALLNVKYAAVTQTYLASGPSLVDQMLYSEDGITWFVIFVKEFLFAQSIDRTNQIIFNYSAKVVDLKSPHYVANSFVP